MRAYCFCSVKSHFLPPSQEELDSPGSQNHLRDKWWSFITLINNVMVTKNPFVWGLIGGWVERVQEFHRGGLGSRPVWNQKSPFNMLSCITFHTLCNISEPKPFPKVVLVTKPRQTDLFRNLTKALLTTPNQIVLVSKSSRFGFYT